MTSIGTDLDERMDILGTWAVRADAFVDERIVELGRHDWDAFQPQEEAVDERVFEVFGFGAFGRRVVGCWCSKTRTYWTVC